MYVCLYVCIVMSVFLCIVICVLLFMYVLVRMYVLFCIVICVLLCMYGAYCTVMYVSIGMYECKLFHFPYVCVYVSNSLYALSVSLAFSPSYFNQSINLSISISPLIRCLWFLSMNFYQQFHQIKNVCCRRHKKTWLDINVPGGRGFLFPYLDSLPSLGVGSLRS